MGNRAPTPMVLTPYTVQIKCSYVSHANQVHIDRDVTALEYDERKLMQKYGPEARTLDNMLFKDELMMSAVTVRIFFLSNPIPPNGQNCLRVGRIQIWFRFAKPKIGSEDHCHQEDSDLCEIFGKRQKIHLRLTSEVRRLTRKLQKFCEKYCVRVALHSRQRYPRFCCLVEKILPRFRGGPKRSQVRRRRPGAKERVFDSQESGHPRCSID
jgi:hypothetical protein